MSGEWTFGAANLLKIVASDSSYPSDVKKKLLAEVCPTPPRRGFVRRLRLLPMGASLLEWTLPSLSRPKLPNA